MQSSASAPVRVHALHQSSVSFSFSWSAVAGDAASCAQTAPWERALAKVERAASPTAHQRLWLDVGKLQKAVEHWPSQYTNATTRQLCLGEQLPVDDTSATPAFGILAFGNLPGYLTARGSRVRSKAFVGSEHPPHNRV